MTKMNDSAVCASRCPGDDKTQLPATKNQRTREGNGVETPGASARQHLPTLVVGEIRRRVLNQVQKGDRGEQKKSWRVGIDCNINSLDPKSKILYINPVFTGYRMNQRISTASMVSSCNLHN